MTLDINDLVTFDTPQAIYDDVLQIVTTINSVKWNTNTELKEYFNRVIYTISRYESEDIKNQYNIILNNFQKIINK